MSERGRSQVVGIKEAAKKLSASFPHLKIGYFNQQVPEVRDQL
jgi:hypothetical protein